MNESFSHDENRESDPGETSHCNLDGTQRLIVFHCKAGGKISPVLLSDNNIILSGYLRACK